MRDNAALRDRSPAGAESKTCIESRSSETSDASAEIISFLDALIAKTEPQHGDGNIIAKDFQTGPAVRPNRPSERSRVYGPGASANGDTPADTGAVDVTSDQGIGQIVKRLSDLLLLSRDIVPPQVHALTDQVLAGLVDQLDVKSRQTLAERVSRSPELPQLLIRRLVSDCEAVAAPILESDQALSDLDLSKLVMTGGLGHRLMIARRSGIGTMTANLLVEREEPDVAKALLDNRLILMDGTTLDLIVEKFIGDSDIMRRLAAREELQPRQGFAMFWHLPPKQRMKILTRFAVSRRQVREAAADLIALINTDISLRSPATKKALRFAFGPIPQLDGTVAETAATTSNEIDTSRLDLMLLTIKQRARIHKKTFSKILADPQGEPLAVLCKAVSIKKPDFICLARVMYKIQAHKITLNEYLDHVAEVYDRLSWDGADIALRYWDQEAPQAR